VTGSPGPTALSMNYSSNRYVATRSTSKALAPDR
jgi:hypothetical protein